MKVIGFFMKTCVFRILLCCVAAAACVAAGKQPVQVRAHNFVVNPSTGPVTCISVRNTSKNRSYDGVLKAGFPEGWKVTQSEHRVSLEPGETKRIPFAIEKATEDMADNSYTVEVAIDSLNVRQNVIWASAPYYKPQIDGKAKEWKDSVPIAFETKGKKTVVRQYWNKKQFCILVEVEEDNLIGLKDASAETGMDAVQFAVSLKDTVTGDNADDKSQRSEFLVVDSGKIFGADSCYILMKPGDTLGKAKAMPELEALELESAQAVVRRSGNTTTYEVAVPVKCLPDLRPTAGREFCFSLLVHDPDGTGVRDMGSIMNLWDNNRKKFGWCSWQNVKWGDMVPFDNKVEFGFCSSIH